MLGIRQLGEGPKLAILDSRRHRCALASALTSTLSIFGRGAQSSEPGGATMTFRPPRRRQAIGTNTVIVLPSGS